MIRPKFLVRFNALSGEISPFSQEIMFLKQFAKFLTCEPKITPMAKLNHLTQRDFTVLKISSKTIVNLSL